jgi:hypothetical protein
MHLLSKIKLILLSPCYLVVKYMYVYAFHHIISIFHLLCIPITYYVHVHANRIARGNHTSRV